MMLSINIQNANIPWNDFRDTTIVISTAMATKKSIFTRKRSPGPRWKASDSNCQKQIGLSVENCIVLQTITLFKMALKMHLVFFMSFRRPDKV